MHVQRVIQDRRYRFRTFQTCFIGREAIDWLILNRHAHTRDEALACMRILEEQEVFHHVCDDHQFKDEHLFYRFRQDDKTYLNNKDLRAFFKGQNLFDKLHTTRDVLRDFHPPGLVYRDAFVGRELLTWMLEHQLAYTRESAVKDCRELLENDIIKHVTDDYHFRDDDLIYQFSLDFHQSYLLSDILSFRRTSSSAGRSSVELTEMRRHSNSVSMRSSPANCPRTDSPRTDSPRTDSPSPGSDTSLTSRNSLTGSPLVRSSPEDPNGRLTPISQGDGSDSNQPKSVLLRHATAEELEDPDTPYIKSIVRLTCDPMGCGFVVRGSSPSYVQTVDPSGPAAAAGIKVRQYIHSINGQNVLRKDHKFVDKLLMTHAGVSTIVVMTHKRSAVS